MLRKKKGKNLLFKLLNNEVGLLSFYQRYLSFELS